jgi:tetratricopeptide (TPR) repeat protein
MATFEEQCELVSKMFIALSSREISDPAVSAIFDKFDMAGPLAVAFAAEDISVLTSRPKQWIAEAYLALKKLEQGDAKQSRNDEVTYGKDKNSSGPFSESKSNSLEVAADFEVQDEPYDSQHDQSQIDEMEEIVRLYQRGNSEEALENAYAQLEKLKGIENVDLFAAYNLAFRIHDDEFRSQEVEAFCRRAFEFVSSFNHVIGASATNTYVYSFLIPEGNIEEAESKLRETISRNFGFESLNALSNLGQLLFRKKDFFRAEAIFSRVRMSDIGHMRPEANYWLGRIYSETGRSEQALKIWQEVALVSRDSYRSLAKDCLEGNIPELDLIPGHAETRFEIGPFISDQTIPDSIPDLESAKAILVSRFPGINFQLPARARSYDEVNDGIGNIAGFLRCLDEFDFDKSTADKNYWSLFLDHFQYYDALDEHIVLFVAELATRSLNLGGWQDASIYSRSHFILGNLKLCIAAWKVAHSLEAESDDSIAGATLKYPVISLYAHLARCGRGTIARQLAQEAEITESDVISYLESTIFEFEGSLTQALATIGKHSSSDTDISELAKAIILIRDQDWKVAREYLWAMDSKRLEMGDESNNGLQKEALRLLCLTGKCEHEMAPARTKVSGIDLICAALVDAYYSRWNEFCSNLAEAKEVSADHTSLVAEIFKKLSADMPLLKLASNKDLPKSILGMICDLETVELLIVLARNESAKEMVAAKNPGTYSIVTGTATREDLKLALESKLEPLALLVAQSDSLDDELISMLATFENEQIVKLVLQNKNCASDIAANLISKLSKDACWEIASNSESDPAILESLAKHDAESVRRAVANNPNTPAACFEELAGDASWTVRNAVKNNENAPEAARAIALLME